MSLQDYGYPTAEQAKSKLFEAMRTHGVGYLEASYSGGNDEGGIDEVDVLKDSHGNPMELELSWQHPINEACDGMLSVEFGSWAGDWSAHGRLFADAKEQKVWREGEQSSYSEDSATY